MRRIPSSRGLPLVVCLAVAFLFLCSSAEAQSASDGALVPLVSVEGIQHNIDTGHPDVALKQIATLRAAHSTVAGLNRLEGLADYELNDLRVADKAFAAALAEDSHDSEAAQMRGLTLFRLGRPADAIPLLEGASKQGLLGKADPNYILALCYMDTRRYDDARHAFEIGRAHV